MYLPLRSAAHDLASELFAEICKTGHFDSTRVKQLRHIGLSWNLDRGGIPTGEVSVRFHRQRRPRVSVFQAAPPSQEELQDILDAHAE